MNQLHPLAAASLQRWHQMIADVILTDWLRSFIPKLYSVPRWRISRMPARRRSC
jgi:hypothetical protein